MAKTRHYRKRTTRSSKRRHNKRTRKQKRGGSSPPRQSRGTHGRTYDGLNKPPTPKRTLEQIEKELREAGLTKEQRKGDITGRDPTVN